MPVPRMFDCPFARKMMLVVGLSPTFNDVNLALLLETLDVNLALQPQCEPVWF
jgi:hypothetical protein